MREVVLYFRMFLASSGSESSVRNSVVLLSVSSIRILVHLVIYDSGWVSFEHLQLWLQPSYVATINPESITAYTTPDAVWCRAS